MNDFSFKKTHDSSLTGDEFEPWITRDAISVLEKLIKKDFIGLEWGSGSSSVWFCERLKHLYTIEHDKEWADFIDQYISNNRKDLLEKWSLFYIPEDDVFSREKIFIDGNGKSRKEYASARNVPNELDFICVDGRSRVGCIKTAVSKLKPIGGILVLDNSDRIEYFPNKIPSGWECIETSNNVWKTTVWISR
jgi:hypothetical protein